MVSLRSVVAAGALVILAAAGILYAAQGRTRVEGVMAGFAPTDEAARMAWVQTQVREALRLAQPVSHYQTESAAESLAHWTNAPRGSWWLHRRPYWTDSTLYYAYVKFHNDSIRRVAFIDPATGFLTSGELDPRWEAWKDTLVYVIGVSDSSLARTGGRQKRLAIDPSFYNNWTAGLRAAKVDFDDSTQTGAWRFHGSADTLRLRYGTTGSFVTRWTFRPGTNLNQLQASHQALDNTNQRGAFTLRNPDIQEEPTLIIRGASAVGVPGIALVEIGGVSGVGSTDANAATQINLYTSGNTKTLGGTLRMQIDTTGIRGKTIIVAEKSARVTVGASHFFGADTTSDGVWRMYRDADTLKVQRRESSAWVTKGQFTP